MTSRSTPRWRGNTATSTSPRALQGSCRHGCAALQQSIVCPEAYLPAPPFVRDKATPVYPRSADGEAAEARRDSGAAAADGEERQAGQAAARIALGQLRPSSERSPARSVLLLALRCVTDARCRTPLAGGAVSRCAPPGRHAVRDATADAARRAARDGDEPGQNPHDQPDPFGAPRLSVSQAAARSSE